MVHDHHHSHASGEAESRDHSTHAGHSVAMFRDRFWWSLALTVPIVFFSEMVQEWFGYEVQFSGSDWIGPILGTILFVYGGTPFLEGAYREIVRREPGMMLLIGMAISVAFVASMASSLGFFDLEFWWELGALITVMLLGHWMEMRSIGQARGALAALAELLPDEAERVTPDGTEKVTIGSLGVGDVVLVRPGGRVPADGEIVEGSAEMDESMVTGESKPVGRETGDTVIAGTVATDSAIRVRITAVGDDTALAGIQRLVAEAQASRSRAQVLADRAAAFLFWVAVSAAAITVITWLALGRVDEAVVRTVSVLVIACPHALGLAIPLVVAISTSMAARSGILVKDRLALERMRSIDVVVFDKTGTLTRGSHVVVDVTAVDGDTDRVLRLAAATEADSEHPLARAIVTAAGAEQGTTRASEFESMSGRGVEATVDGQRIAVGGPSLARERGTDLSPLSGWMEEWEGRGAALLHVTVDGSLVGAIALEDEIRPESRTAVEMLREKGVRVAMITGDARQVASAVAAELGIDEVRSEVLPEDKHEAVADLQRDGSVVAMVGDGVNDAPALTRADVGIAIGSGTDVAVESAGIILVQSNPLDVVRVIELSRASYRKMIQNLWWAAGYNIFALPLAAGAFVWLGIPAISPAIGALLMSLSTVIVAINAQLLRRADLAPA